MQRLLPGISKVLPPYTADRLGSVGIITASDPRASNFTLGSARCTRLAIMEIGLCNGEDNSEVRLLGKLFGTISSQNHLGQSA